MTREEKEQIGKYVLQMARLLEDGCYQQEMLLKAVHIIDEALEQEPCEDWYDVPSDEMTLEQARQAVRDLRKKLVECLEQEPTTKNDLGVDLVLRAEVLKLMKDNWHTHNGDWAMQESMDDIRALPSVTPQEPRWIPVSERLPEEYGEYLITWTTSSSKKPFIAICECENTTVYDHEHIRFKVEWLFDDYIKAYPDVEVRAWMPLPKPYKAESEK